jgi:hypothetical protein
MPLRRTTPEDVIATLCGHFGYTLESISEVGVAVTKPNRVIFVPVGVDTLDEEIVNRICSNADFKMKDFWNHCPVLD